MAAIGDPDFRKCRPAGNRVSGVRSVSSADFREIAVSGDVGKAERLFRAAVSAFCSLTRPSRRDATQLDDLTLPLFDMVSVESRRYVAAALSECEIAPMELVRRLCDEHVSVCAPLLVRSRALGDVDLIALIGKHGVSHARAIARRPILNLAISHLAKALEGAVSAQPAPVAASEPASGPDASADATLAGTGRRGQASEEIRHRLRMMMRPEFDGYEGATIRPIAEPSCFAKLRDTAMTGNLTFFQTALADALKLNFRTARTITETSSHSPLMVALRALDLSEEQAFLVASAVSPQQFPHPEAIRLFLDRYRALGHDMALERVRGWKVEMVATWINENVHAPRPGNSDRPATGTADGRLRA